MDISEVSSIEDDAVSEIVPILDDPVIDMLGESERQYQNVAKKKLETLHFINESTKNLLKEITDGTNATEIHLYSYFLYNNKYAFWFRLTNRTDEPLKKFNFLLHWNSDEALSYETQIHQDINSEMGMHDPFSHCELLVNEAFLIVIFDKPNFVEKKCITIEGSLSYSDDNGKLYVDDIDPFVLQNKDICNREIHITCRSKLDIVKLHTRLLCSFRVDLVVQLQTDQSLLESLACASLIPVSPVTSSKLPRFFAISDDSYNFHGTLLELISTCKMTHSSEIAVYTKDVDTLLSFFHHLYSTIEPLLLLPGEYKNRLPSKRSSEVEKHFHSCLDDEEKQIKNFSYDIEKLYRRYPDLKKRLINLEYATDSAYFRYLESQNKRELQNPVINE